MIESELNCAGDPGATFKALVAAGADARCILGAPIYGAIGYSPIRTSGDLYEPADHGQGAVLVGVRDDDDGELIDIVAFDPERPAKFWRRTGAAVFLGWRAVEIADHYLEPLTLHPTPLHWLRHGCEGAVFLDLGRRLSFWTAGISEIRTLSPDFGRAIERRLADESRTAVPRVMVPRAAA